MKIWALIVYWNEERYIRQCLYSTLPFVDGFILVDGAYYQDEIYDYFSTDQTNDFIEEFLKKYHKTKKIKWFTSLIYGDSEFYSDLPLHQQIDAVGWHDEMEKRNFSINQVPNGDWMLIIDADTIIIGDDERFRQQIANQPLPVYNTPVMEYVHPAGWWEAPMLMRKEEGMKYKGTHWNIEFSDGKNQWEAPHNDYHIIRNVYLLNMGIFYREERRYNPKMHSIASRSPKESFAKRKRERIWEEMYNARWRYIQDDRKEL